MYGGCFGSDALPLELFGRFGIMPRKTIHQKKMEIRTWRAMYDGKCPLCNGEIKGDAGKYSTLVCRHPKFPNLIIHYSCHPDWRPAPFPGFTYQGRKLKPGEKLK